MDDPFEADRYFYGMAGLIALIGPRVWGEAGSREELLLFAALACYQERLGQHPDEAWPGSKAHVLRAFVHMRRIGEGAAANVLHRMVAQRATAYEGTRRFDEEFRADKSPAQRAAHEQVMADGDRRNLRAAKALDGTNGGPWASMPST